MKIGIITCHDVYNFGASLQAFALCEFCRIQKFSAEIINYKPSYLYKLIDLMEVDSLRWRKNWLFRWIYRIYVLPSKLRWIGKYCKFKSFNKKYLKLSRRKIKTIEGLKKKMSFDIYICGSDQIWNSSKYLCGQDPAFFLAFTEGKKISYAASIGGKEVSKKGAENIKKYLPFFNAVSVREKSTLDILRKFDIESFNAIDPVFLIDSSYWEQIAKKIKNIPPKYIFAYGYDNSLEAKEAVEYYRAKMELPVIDNNSLFFINAGPLEFISLIKNASIVITSSFHAIAFSIILQVQFVAVKTENEDLFERISNILEISGLENREYSELKKVKNWELERVDFSNAEKKIQKHVEQSKEFLLNAIEE